jgi:hypothetical protein
MITLKQIGRYLLENPNKKFCLLSQKCIIAKMTGQPVYWDLPFWFVVDEKRNILCKNKIIRRLADDFGHTTVTGKTLFRQVLKLTRKSEKYFY